MWNLLLEEVWLTSLNSKLFCFNSAGTLVVDICTYIVFIAPPPLYIHMYVHILRDMYRSCSKRKRLREGDVVIEDTTYVCIGVVVADVTLPEFRKLMCPECEEFFCYDCSMEWHEGATCRGS